MQDIQKAGAESPRQMRWVSGTAITGSTQTDGKTCFGQRKMRYPNIKPRIIKGTDTGTMIAIKDGYPVTEGHTLVIPKRHVAEYFDLSDAERRDADSLLRILQRKMIKNDPSIIGYNIGVNCGKSAGQTIFHLHYHLIPRRDGDTENPRGGIRGVMPGKRGY